MSEGVNEGGSIWLIIFTGNWVLTSLLLILLVMSAVSWAIIVLKWIHFRRVQAENQHFYSVFKRDQTLADVFSLSRRFSFSPLARMFDASYQEVTAFRKNIGDSTPPPDARERLMTYLSRRLETIYNQQNSNLEYRLQILATVSASAPFLGLLGTVMGIIDAFQNIGQMGVTSIAVVAPGISVALITTAAGLVAAIPALVAYNSFRNRIRIINVAMKNFALEVTNRFERLL